MIEHLSLFIGEPYPYILRFQPNDIVQFIATDGHLMCMNEFKIPHSGKHVSVAISAEEFIKFIMFGVTNISLSTDGTKLILRHGSSLVDIPTLPPELIPNLDNVFNKSYVGSADLLISPKYLARITDYIKLIDHTGHLKLKYTGDNDPLVVVGQDSKWKIYIMPLER